LVRQTRKGFEIRIISGVVSKDHVYIFVSVPLTMAPSEIMKRIKGRTASKLFEEFPVIKKRYWGRHFFGAEAFFVSLLAKLWMK
jgi:putative transposase